MSIDVSRTLTAEAAPGTILELLQRQRSELKPQSRSAPQPTQPARPTAASSRRRFLLEFEATGDVAAACHAADCSIYNVRHWRTTDPGFQRDFALAAEAHIRDLRRMVKFVADGAHHYASEAARQLLASEGRYVGADSRLDVRRWRDALLSFLHRVGINPTEWEPPDTD